jgi:hypothetical protein
MSAYYSGDQMREYARGAIAAQAPTDFELQLIQQFNAGRAFEADRLAPLPLPVQAEPLIQFNGIDDIQAKQTERIRFEKFISKGDEFTHWQLWQAAITGQPAPAAQEPLTPLTEQQIGAIESAIWIPHSLDETERQANVEFARAIEAMHGIAGAAK